MEEVKFAVEFIAVVVVTFVIFVRTVAGSFDGDALRRLDGSSLGDWLGLSTTVGDKLVTNVTLTVTVVGSNDGFPDGIELGSEDIVGDGFSVGSPCGAKVGVTVGDLVG